MKLRTLNFFLTAALGATSSASAITETWDTSTSAGIQTANGTWTWNIANILWTTDGGATNVGWTNGNDAALAVPSAVPFISIGNDAITAGTVTVTGGGTPVLQGNLNNLSFTQIDINTSGAGKLAIYGTSGSPGKTLTGGTINISNGATLFAGNISPIIASNITVTGTGNSEGLGAIRLREDAKISGNVTLNGNSNLGVDANQAGEISGKITGTFSITKVVAGKLVLSGTNDYTGTTTISAGTLQIGNGGTTGSLSASSAITNNGTLTFNRSNTLTQGSDFANAIGGSGAVTQAGSGTTVLSSTNNYTGITTVTAGTLQAGNVSALGSGTVNISGGNLTTTVTNLGTGALSLTSGSLTLNGIGAGTVTLGLNKDFTMSGGLWSLDLAAGLDQIIGQSSGTADFVISGGTLNLGGGSINYGTTYQLLTGFTTGSVSGLTISGYDTANHTAMLSNTGVLSFVPEPSVALLGGLGLLAMLRRRR